MLGHHNLALNEDEVSAPHGWDAHGTDSADSRLVSALDTEVEASLAVTPPTRLGKKTFREYVLRVSAPDTFAALYNFLISSQSAQPTPSRVAVIAQTPRMAKLASNLFKNIPNASSVLHVGKRDFCSKKGKPKALGPAMAQVFQSASRSMVFSATLLGVGGFADFDCVVHLGLPIKTDCKS